MSEKATDLAAAFRSLIEEGRRELGPEPTPEELLAYHDGELSDTEAERFRERLAHYPDAAALLAAFTTDHEPSPGDPEYRSPEAEDAAWTALRKRALGDDPPPAEVAPVLAPSPAQSSSPWLRLAAGLLIGAVAGGSLVAIVGQRRTHELAERVADLQQPRVPTLEELAPDRPRRGREADARPLDRNADPHFLELDLPPDAVPDEAVDPRYRLEIVPVEGGGSSGEAVWSKSDVAPLLPAKVIRLFLPIDPLPSGRLEIRVYLEGEEGGAAPGKPVATYTIES